jgi:hypothetical protein
MKNTKARNHYATQPSAVANYTFRPVSGLISGVNLNHHLPMLHTQWRTNDSLLIYRCGGSFGFGIGLTDFPFNH